jgi:hypothetical protein
MVYGLGTRSYNRSTEARENKRAVRAATEKFLNAPRVEVLLGPEWLVCRCDGRMQPHATHGLREIVNFRPWFRYAYLLERANNGAG